MLLLPMFLASVHLSPVNLNGIGDALMAADGPGGTRDGLTGAFAPRNSRTGALSLDRVTVSSSFGAPGRLTFRRCHRPGRARWPVADGLRWPGHGPG